MSTEEYLERLVHDARTVGWTVDYTEVAQFVSQVFDIHDLEPPTDEELEPYPFNEKDEKVIPPPEARFRLPTPN